MTDAVILCAECGRELEECAVCTEEACGAALCYRCLRLALLETVPHPHGHGG